MKGTRPLDNDEIRRVSGCFTGTYEIRNRSLFMLGVSTGGRISELLSLRVGDVYQNRSAVSDLLFSKSIVKGKENSRAVPVNQDGRRAINEVVRWHREHYRSVASKRPLFPSRHNSGSVPTAPSNSTCHTQRCFHGSWTQRTHRDTFTAEVFRPETLRQDKRHLSGARVAWPSEHQHNPEVLRCQLCGCQSRRRSDCVNHRV